MSVRHESARHAVLWITDTGTPLLSAQWRERESREQRVAREIRVGRAALAARCSAAEWSGWHPGEHRDGLGGPSAQHVSIAAARQTAAGREGHMSTDRHAGTGGDWRRAVWSHTRGYKTDTGGARTATERSDASFELGFTWAGGDGQAGWGGDQSAVKAATRYGPPPRQRPDTSRSTKHT